jgi:tRNA-dihydrouridine synthase B
MNDSFVKQYQLNGRSIYPNAYPASMSGVTDAAFRRLLKKLSGNRTPLLVSEFISVEGFQGNIHHSKCRQAQFFADEKPFVMQIFGHTPKYMAQAAQNAQKMGADYLEVNCGCPAPKVVGKGGGAGLLKDLPNLKEILLRIKDAIEIPLLVKIRIGWDDDSINVMETVALVQECGAAQCTIHGRTRMQGYRGQADWDWIAQAAQFAHIPILGNGDVRSPQEAAQRIAQTGVQGVVLGRATLHNPWIFGQIADYWERGSYTHPTMDEQEQMFSLYADLLLETFKVDTKIIGRLKQLTARFANGLTHSTELMREQVLRTPDLQTFMESLHKFYAQARLGDAPLEYRPDLVRNLNGQKDKETLLSGNEY